MCHIIASEGRDRIQLFHTHCCSEMGLRELIKAHYALCHALPEIQLDLHETLSYVSLRCFINRLQPKTFFSAASEFKSLVGQPPSCWWYTLGQTLERKCILWSLLSPSPALLTSLTVFSVKWQRSDFIESMSAGRRFLCRWKGPPCDKHIKKACEVNLC